MPLPYLFAGSSYLPWWLAVFTVLACHVYRTGLPVSGILHLYIGWTGFQFPVKQVSDCFRGGCALAFFLSFQRLSLIPTSLIPGRSVSGRRWVILKRYSPAFPMRTIPARSVDWYSPPQPSPDQTPVLSASFISNVSFFKFCVSGLS